MATFSAVTRQHILSAIAECDDRGTENFLGVYGFTPSVRETLDHEGRTYDSKAILGVAHKHATGRTATAEELDGSRIDATTILRKHGFEAYGPVAPTPPPVQRARRATSAAPRARTTSAPRRAAEPERPAPICPTCFMTLPATGVCDSCG